ncbi:hypothetical protein GCM10027589_02370 [Actinocorallia lasiicapitis]
MTTIENQATEIEASSHSPNAARSGRGGSRLRHLSTPDSVRTTVSMVMRSTTFHLCPR